jgi:hypothetical protein
VTDWIIKTGPLGPHAILPGVGSVFLMAHALEWYGVENVPRDVLDELYRLDGRER